MSDYKRFVSYIYGYEQGEKGENTGFVKVNARGGECKIWVHMRGFYTHRQKPYRVYAFMQKRERLEGQYLGQLESRNGALEWNGVTKTESLMGGFGLEDSRGIFIEGENRVFAAEWDDYPVDVEQFEPLERSARQANVGPGTKKLGSEAEETTGVVKEDKERQRVSGSEGQKEPGRVSGPEERAEKVEEAQSISGQQEQKKEKSEVLRAAELQETMEEPAPAEISGDDAKPVTVETFETGKSAKPAPAEMAEGGAEAFEMKTDAESFASHAVRNMEIEPETQTDEPEDGRRKQWEYLTNHFPVMRYQDGNGGVISSIRLGSRDLSRIPRDKWELGNNSFLLHGFYQHRHLLLLRRQTRTEVRYYIGVPGVYNEKEQLLASMFGFEEFKMMKEPESREGNFGYWCRLLK